MVTEKDNLDNKHKLKITFICTGNTCRSPMAEGLLKDTMPESWKGRVEVSSAGIMASGEAPAAPDAVKAMGDKGIDLKDHLSTPLSAAIIDESDLMVTMTTGHALSVIAMVPAAKDKVLVIGTLDPEREDPDIEDPVGMGIEVYLRTMDVLGKLTTLLIEEISRRFDLET